MNQPVGVRARLLDKHEDVLGPEVAILSGEPGPRLLANPTGRFVGRPLVRNVYLRRKIIANSFDDAADLIIVDDIGMLPVSPDAAEGFYRLVDSAYERRSLTVSSNLHPSGFDEIMPKTLATATVDRLLHHAHVCVTSGESFRLAEATNGKGVTPLT